MAARRCDVDMAAVTALYLAGYPVADIARTQGVSISTLQDRLKAVLPEHQRRKGPVRKQVDIDAVTAEYRRGDSVAAIAARHGVHPMLIRSRLIEYGVLKHRTRRLDINPRVLKIQYLQGRSLAALARAHGVSQAVIRTRLLDAGTDLRSTVQTRHLQDGGDYQGLAKRVGIHPDVMLSLLIEYRLIDGNPLGS